MKTEKLLVTLNWSPASDTELAVARKNAILFAKKSLLDDLLHAGLTKNLEVRDLGVSVPLLVFSGSAERIHSLSECVSKSRFVLHSAPDGPTEIDECG